MIPPGGILESVIHLLTLGYSMVPSGSGPKGKYPLIKWKEFQKRLPTEAELEHWHNSMHPRLWGVITGEVSGIVVIDTDDTEARLILEKAGLTPHILTPRCANFWFQHPGHFVKTEAGILPNLDIRGDKGFVNVVGTRSDGGTYRIIKWPAPENIYSWEQLPTSIAKAVTKNGTPELCPMPIYRRVEGEETHIPKVTGTEDSLADLLLRRAVMNAADGTRNHQGLWLCCQLRDNGLSRPEAEPVLLQYAGLVRSLDPDDPYTEDEALSSLEQAYSRPPREPWSILRPKRFTYV